ncbi:Blp family class II bacteriocin [Petroclostridium xylanilyticum]|jgi:hypothetical protein|uniref:Blp family class II bacteriocin n=1 Tax=Petroclostridium xylanilyticum TaxID=1792311 RepID=UPI0018E36423|nr:hypothetical protein [Petroclostridium xylanilyticum]
MDAALNINSINFMELNKEELMCIDGGVNWDRVFAGTATYLGATLAVAMMTTPVTAPVAVTYLAISAISGAYVGYGLVTD